MSFKSDCDVTPPMSNEINETVIDRARSAELLVIYRNGTRGRKYQRAKAKTRLVWFLGALAWGHTGGALLLSTTKLMTSRLHQSR